MIRLLLVLALVGATTPAPLSLEVWPRRAIGRADVRVLATVERHPDNRELAIVLDGPEYRAQHIQLNAHPDIEDQRLHERWFKYVAPGAYVVHSTVTRTGGRRFAASSAICLIDTDVICEEDR